MNITHTKNLSITYRYSFITVLLASILFIATDHYEANAFTQESSTKSDYIISFKSDSLRNEYSSIFQKKGQTVNQRYQSIPALATTLTDNQVAQLQADTNITSISKDEEVKLEPIQIQSTSSSTGQTTDWGIDKIGVKPFWDAGFEGWGVHVAVLDTGIGNHPDLDIRGGKSFVSSEPSWVDEHGHGTHVAGIIAAKNNAIGTVGVAPRASIYAVKVVNKNGRGKWSDIIAGIEWSILKGMDIINMSLGASAEPSQLKPMVDKAVAHGISIVASAGNDNSCPPDNIMRFPAAYDSVISVGATDSTDKRACFSNTGPELDVVAPGVSILSTIPKNKYGYMSGTSMAAPYVSGLLAILKGLSIYQNGASDNSPSQLKSLLESNALDLGKAGKDDEFGHGLIQAGSEKLPMLTGLTVTNISSFSANISWNHPKATFDDYVVKITGRGSSKQSEGKTSNVGLSLTPGTLYNVSIYARDFVDDSWTRINTSPTASTSFTTPVLNPAAPNVKIETSDSVTSINLDISTIAKPNDWKNGPVRQLSLYVNDVFSEKWNAQDGTTYKKTFSNLPAATTYSFYVVAENEAGSTTTNKVIGKTGLEMPKVTHSYDENSEILKLNWEPISGATAYELNGTEVLTGTQATIKNVRKNDTHSYNVRAVKYGQSSSSTSSDSFRSALFTGSYFPSPLYIILKKPNETKHEFAYLYLNFHTTGTYTFILPSIASGSWVAKQHFRQNKVLSSWALNGNELSLTFIKGTLINQDIRITSTSGKTLSLIIIKNGGIVDTFRQPI
jgi:subtilisin family serine protease